MMMMMMMMYIHCRFHFASIVVVEGDHLTHCKQSLTHSIRYSSCESSFSSCTLAIVMTLCSFQELS